MHQSAPGRSVHQAAEAESGRSETVETDIPARLDPLPFGRFHLLVVGALGITWMLDGLEVTLAGSLSGALESNLRPEFSDAEIGVAGSTYLAGAVRALFFGWLTDAWAARNVLDHAGGLSGRHRCDRAVLGCVELYPVPLPDRRRHRRRIRRDQFGHPGTDPGAAAAAATDLASTAASGSAPRSARGGVDRPARTRPFSPANRLARRLPDRRA